MLRDTWVSIRFNQDELVYIKKQMDKIGFKTRSKYMRYACLNGFVIIKTTIIIDDAIERINKQIYELNLIGCEINQMAKTLNSGGDIDIKNVLYNKKVLQDITTRNKVELSQKKNKKRVDRFALKEHDNKVRESIIKFRVSKDELDIIDNKMKDIGITSQSQYVRRMCIDNFILKVDNSHEQELFKVFADAERELSAIKKNIRQVASKIKFSENIKVQDIYDILDNLTQLSQYNENLIDNTIEDYHEHFERTGANGLYKH